MADPFISEIRVLPFNFAPKGWAWCDGQRLPLSQNTALFALIGTTYGGDGLHNYALPDLRDRVPMHPGPQGTHHLGDQGGFESVELLESEIPRHVHAFSASVRPSDSVNPGGVSPGTGNNMYVAAADASMTAMAVQALAPAGASKPHNNMQPYLALRFCIALEGVFPPRP